MKLLCVALMILVFSLNATTEEINAFEAISIIAINKNIDSYILKHDEYRVFEMHDIGIVCYNEISNAVAWCLPAGQEVISSNNYCIGITNDKNQITFTLYKWIDGSKACVIKTEKHMYSTNIIPYSSCVMYEDDDCIAVHVFSALYLINKITNTCDNAIEYALENTYLYKNIIYKYAVRQNILTINKLYCLEGMQIIEGVMRINIKHNACRVYAINGCVIVISREQSEEFYAQCEVIVLVNDDEVARKEFVLLKSGVLCTSNRIYLPSAEKYVCYDKVVAAFVEPEGQFVRPLLVYKNRYLVSVEISQAHKRVYIYDEQEVKTKVIEDKYILGSRLNRDYCIIMCRTTEGELYDKILTSDYGMEERMSNCLNQYIINRDKR